MEIKCVDNEVIMRCLSVRGWDAYVCGFSSVFGGGGGAGVNDFVVSGAFHSGS